MKYLKLFENFNFNINKYNSFKDLTEKDLYDIAKWGLLGEYDNSGAWDYANYFDKSTVDVAAKAIVEEDFKIFLNQEFPEGFKNIPNKVTLYRFITLENEDELNRNNLGLYWFADINKPNEYGKGDDFFTQLTHLTIDKPKNHKLYIIKTQVDESQIDIPRTLWQRSFTNNENEIRLKDDKNVEIISIEDYYNRKIS
jgi:hypothetical protein